MTEGVTGARPKRMIYDLERVDPEGSALDLDTIHRFLPQRHEFAMVDRVCHLDREERVIVAIKDFGAEDWWTKGHFPGRPLVPGVLLTEASAQVATLLWKALSTLEIADRTVVFGGLERVRFRGQVVPPARVFFLAREGRISGGGRMARFPTQAIHDGRVVYEGEIIGVCI